MDRTKLIILVYRIYYKVMSTTLNPRALRYTPKKEIVLLITNLEKNNLVIVLKRLNWKSIIWSVNWT